MEEQKKQVENFCNTGYVIRLGTDQYFRVNIPVRQHRKSGRRETVCPGLRKPLMRVYSRNVLSKP